jgi:hypothetical protein
MAKKKETPESLIVGFFTQSDLSAATTLHNVVNGIMKTRNAQTPAAPATKNTRGSRKGSTNATAPATTAAAASETSEAAAA